MSRDRMSELTANHDTMSSRYLQCFGNEQVFRIRVQQKLNRFQ